MTDIEALTVLILIVLAVVTYAVDRIMKRIRRIEEAIDIDPKWSREVDGPAIEVKAGKGVAVSTWAAGGGRYGYRDTGNPDGFDHE